MNAIQTVVFAVGMAVIAAVFIVGAITVGCLLIDGWWGRK